MSQKLPVTQRHIFLVREWGTDSTALVIVSRNCHSDEGGICSPTRDSSFVGMTT